MKDFIILSTIQSNWELLINKKVFATEYLQDLIKKINVLNSLKFIILIKYGIFKYQIRWN